MYTGKPLSRRYRVLSGLLYAFLTAPDSGAQVTASKSPERKGEGHPAEKLNLRGVEVYKQQQAMSYKDIEHLAFGFKHIVQIDHLEGLINLKKLQLDNNCLTKIENLGHLVRPRFASGTTCCSVLAMR